MRLTASRREREGTGGTTPRQPPGIPRAAAAVERTGGVVARGLPGTVLLGLADRPELVRLVAGG
jgi:hypothetical protein